MLRPTVALVLSTLSTLFAVSWSSGLAAQSGPQNVGIYVSENGSTISGVICGFDCANPGNVVPVASQVTRTIDVRVLGDLGMPGFIILSVSEIGSCPGLVVPGIGNSVLVAPWNAVYSGGVGSLGPYRAGGCNTGVGLVIAGWQLPVAAQGVPITFQGLVFANGVPAFTRAIRLTAM